MPGAPLLGDVTEGAEHPGSLSMLILQGADGGIDEYGLSANFLVSGDATPDSGIPEGAPELFFIARVKPFAGEEFHDEFARSLP